MWGNLCKHQLVIIFMVMDVTQEDVIEYCRTWYGSKLATFVNPKHIPNDSDFEDDGFADDHDEGVIDIGGIGPTDDSLPPINDGGACVAPISSVVFLDKTFFHLCHTM
jgi:hypothetical protein